MATGNPRALWKGAISFGLVHVPVALYSATQDVRPKMRMLDQATGAPVGYRKVAKDTGETVDKSGVVKGMEIDAGQYVTLTKEEIREALPRSTQTIEIESFVKVDEVPSVFYNKPYYTGPILRGQKVYALLREVLRRTGRAALGRVVVSNRQHLALLVPMGDALVLNLLRWSEEIRDAGSLELPGNAAGEGLSERELKMGEQLVLELADDWHPERFRDEFREKLEALVEAKRSKGDVRQAPGVEAEAPPPSAEVIDLTELLKQSLKRAPTPTTAAKAAKAPAPAPAVASARKRTAQTASSREAANDEARQRAAAAEKPASARTSVKPRASAGAKAPRRKAG